MNKAVLVEKIFEKLKDINTERPSEPVMKIAIVGKRNAGKSSMVNAIVGDERVIVSEVPGTTRDAVDVRFEKDGQTYIVIDTAGVRKKGRIVQNDIEYYSYVRATKAVSRADVVLFMIDSTVPISQVDKKLASVIMEEYKTCIIVVNKWDLAKEKATSEDYEDYLTKILPMLKFAPIAFTTATEQKNVQGVLDLAASLFKQATTWIPTPKLNDIIEKLKEEKEGKLKGGFGVGPKIYYATQIAVNPVTLLLFVNKPDKFDENFRKFLSSRLSLMLGMDDVPIRILARSRPRAGEEEKETRDE